MFQKKSTCLPLTGNHLWKTKVQALNWAPSAHQNPQHSHPAQNYSKWQHLISSCQLQHGNLIRASQLEPGGSHCDEMSTAQWTCQTSYHATPLQQVSFLWAYCHGNDCWWNVVTRKAGGIARFQKSKPPRRTSPQWNISETFLTADAGSHTKFFHYSIGASWLCVHTEQGRLRNVLRANQR